MSRFKMPVAVHLFLRKDNKVLLLRRFNTGYEDGNYSVIAGHVDAHEHFIHAMIREAKEEAAIDISEHHIRPIQVMHRKGNDERIDYFFEATQWRGTVTNTEPEKCDQLKWYPLDALPCNTIPYIQRALKNYLSGHVFTTFGWEENNK